MADRLQSFQNSAVATSTTRDLDNVKPAELEVLKPKIEGALPAAVAPLMAKEHMQSIGAVVGQAADHMRLEPRVDFRSYVLMQTHVRRFLGRLNQPAAEAEGPFVAKEQAMKAVLENHMSMLRQIGVQLGNTQKA